MSNETKRDVFEKALRSWDDLVHDLELQGEEYHGACEFDQILNKYRRDYAAALPDDLPVIPQMVANAIEWFLQNNETIGDVWFNLRQDVDDDWYQVPNLRAPEEWMLANQDEFTRAWLLGIWRVEETGEIVKLEAED